MSIIIEKLKKSSEGSGENSPVEALSPVKKKVNWVAWLPLGFFVFATLFTYVLYTTEHTMRLDGEKALASARKELADSQAAYDKLQKETSEAQKSLSDKFEEINHRIQDQEAEKSALEKERDQYKENSWNSQSELMKVKAELATLRAEADKVAALSQAAPVAAVEVSPAPTEAPAETATAAPAQSTVLVSEPSSTPAPAAATT